MDSSNSLMNGDETNSVTSDLNNISLTVKSRNEIDIRAARANSAAKYKPEKWMLPEKAENMLIQLNLAIVSKVLCFTHLSIGVNFFFFCFLSQIKRNVILCDVS